MIDFNSLPRIKTLVRVPYLSSEAMLGLVKEREAKKKISFNIHVFSITEENNLAVANFFKYRESLPSYFQYS